MAAGAVDREFFDILTLSETFGSLWGALGLPLAVLWGPFGRLGAPVGPLWASFGSLWLPLGCPWALFGRPLGSLWSSWGTCWIPLGRFSENKRFAHTKPLLFRVLNLNGGRDG